MRFKTRNQEAKGEPLFGARRMAAVVASSGIAALSLAPGISPGRPAVLASKERPASVCTYKNFGYLLGDAYSFLKQNNYVMNGASATFTSSGTSLNAPAHATQFSKEWRTIRGLYAHVTFSGGGFRLSEKAHVRYRNSTCSFSSVVNLPRPMNWREVIEGGAIAALLVLDAYLISQAIKAYRRSYE